MMNLNEFSQTDKLELMKKRIADAEADPVELIDHFLYTFDPKREPYHLPFRLFPFQKNLVREIQQAIVEGYDIFIEKTREMGATYTVLDTLLWFWMYIPGSNFLLGSRKESYVDNRGGSIDGEVKNKEESLFGKIDYTIDRMPAFLLPRGFKRDKHFTHMSLINPINGNSIGGESANPNFSRAGRQKAILMDEFAFWEHDASAWGATADTTNCRIVLTTPGIKPSKAKRLRFGKDGEKIKIITLPYNLDPRKDKAWLERQRERRSAEDFAREIMINWDTSIQGKVYNEIQYAEVGQFPYNPSWPLYLSWDFGLDGLAIQWWQRNMNNGRKRLVEAYCNLDLPIDFYFPFVGRDIDSKYHYSNDDLEVIDKVKQWKKAVHYGDPDVSKRSLLTGTSTRQALRDVGVYVQTNPQSNDFVSRREKTKVMLQDGIEVNDTKGTEYWLECMTNARYPQRQEDSQATSPINLPIHDWTSHHRTATEYFAVNYVEVVTQSETVHNEVDPDPYN